MASGFLWTQKNGERRRPRKKGREGFAEHLLCAWQCLRGFCFWCVFCKSLPLNLTLAAALCPPEQLWSLVSVCGHPRGWLQDMPWFEREGKGLPGQVPRKISPHTLAGAWSGVTGPFCSSESPLSPEMLPGLRLHFVS